MTRPRSLRWKLFQVLLFGLLPIGLFAATLLYLHWRTQDAERARAQMETTRLLAAVLDNELDSTIRRITILGRLFPDRRAGLEHAYAHAQRSLAASPDWALLLAADREGRALFRTDAPLGAPIPPIADRAYYREVLARRGPVVSELFVSPVSNQPIVAVAVPWIENGEIVQIVGVGLKLKWLDELLRAQGLPPGGISGIFDGRMKFVARSHDADARRGQDPAPALLDDMKARPEGIGRYPSLDNTSVYTSWTRSRHGWWIAVATPAAPIDGAFWRYFALLAGLFAAMLAAGLAFAALTGRRITSALTRLEARAGALAQGHAAGAAPASHIAEVDSVMRAIERASALLAAAQAERDRLLESEQRGRAAAEQANRAKDEFLAMLGHELRNPLAAVSNAASIIASGNRTAPQLEFAAGVIERQSAHLKRLIDDLLDVGRVMNGKILLERRPLDLEASVRHVLSTLSTAGTFARHHLSVDLAAAWMNGDHTRVEQVVSNLLVNAATYTPPGGTIDVRLTLEQGEAVLRVSDNGKGIRAEHLPRLFELFFQAEPSGARAHGGLGIGLTLVKRLVELHGGRVDAASAGPDRGASFTVRLPAIEAPRAGAAGEVPKPGAARTVLVVEDNVDERETLRMALELHGHRVLQAGDVPSALEQIAAGRPSIAFVDIGLPGADGYELAREIRARPHGARPVMIALTGYGSEEDARRARDAGFAGHLTKPVAVSELAAIVARTVS